MDTLAVNEIYGPTFQGEGRNLGHPCFFLRLAGCNLHCHWCDTPYTWRWSEKYPHDSNKVFNPHEEIHPMTVGMVLGDLYARMSEQRRKIQHLVISGGEPLLQQRTLHTLTRALMSAGIFVEIETAGSIIPTTTEMAHQFNVSPKLSTSGNPYNLRYNPLALRTLNNSGRAIFKFVVVDEEDFVEIDAMVKEFSLHPVYIMPEGINAEEIHEKAEGCAKAAIERGYRYTPRLHVDLYGSRRGV